MKTPTQNSMIRRRPQRDLDAIYSRQLKRAAGRQESFAPDFFHGAFMLAELYESCARGWVDSCAFVERLVDEDGELLGYTVASFQDYFLTVEHGLIGEVADLPMWLAQRTARHRLVVELSISAQETTLEPSLQLAARQNYIPIACPLARLNQLERQLLQVTRDIDERPRSLMSPEALIRQSQTNILSLIGLCAHHLSEDFDAATERCSD